MRSSSLLCSASDFSYACRQKETLSKNLSLSWVKDFSASRVSLICCLVFRMYSVGCIAFGEYIQPWWFDVGFVYL